MEVQLVIVGENALQVLVQSTSKKLLNNTHYT